MKRKKKKNFFASNFSKFFFYLIRPRRVQVLMEQPLRETTSFVDCSRIYCLQGPFNQHVWRMPSVAHRLYG